jgi:hypothetical protein
MPDITMCPGEGCPKKHRCYRFRAFTAGRQDWFGSTPWDPATGQCDRFWDVTPFEASEEKVRARAYALWEAAGRPEGQAEAHWHAARRELEKDVLSPDIA